MNVSQLAANTLITAAPVVLVGLGFSLLYRITKFFNLTYAFLFLLGPYCVLSLRLYLNLQPLAAVLCGVVIVGLVGCLFDTLIYRFLRRKKASSLVLLLSSLGIYVVAQNILSLIFGDESINLGLSQIQEGWNILGARITSIQILILGVTAVVVMIISVVVLFTRFGLASRAVSSSSALAEASGISPERTILSMTFVSSLVAGLAGILVAMDVNINPTMGMAALMVGLVAMLVGGVGSILGVVLGALLLALSQHVGVWFIGSQWQDSVTFVILLIFLLIRPQGFGGLRSRRATF